MISLELAGTPIAQKRPRISSNGKSSWCYDSQKQLKEGCQWQLSSQFRESPLTIPVSIDLIFFMPIPKSASAIKKRQMQNGIVAHIKKPDIDNLQKFILDCMNGVVFKDDSQVCEIRAKKIYSSKPATLIRVIPLADEKREILYENCSRENRE